MQSNQVPLVGSIVERNPTSLARVSSPTRNESQKNGFPLVQHRSKSAFSRARENSKAHPNSQRPQHAPIIRSSPGPQLDVPSREASPSVAGLDDQKGSDDWRAQMEEDNQRRVESMTDEELEDARREILQKFGFNVSETLQKARKTRKGELEMSKPDSEEKPSPDELSSQGQKSRASSPTHSVLVTPGISRPPSRGDRHIRFADLSAGNVHVYQSAPSSPKRKPLALTSPTEADGPVIALGDWKGKSGHDVPAQPSDTASTKGAEEGTPEDIRKRFFPSAPLRDPALEWMQTSKPSSMTNSSASSTLRFDLTGIPIPASLSSSLPTHLGLHHHAEGEHAGYTLEDIFLLSRSTVPGQRTTMFDVMRRIGQKLAKKEIPELAGQEESLRMRMILSGIDAMDARGSLGVAAIDVVWTCVVAWSEDLHSIEGVELENTKSNDPSSPLVDVLSATPLDESLLPKVARIFAALALPPESVSRALAVLHRYAQHSDQDASSIVAYPGLINSIFQISVLTPIFPPEDSTLPDPLALRLVHTLITSSRSNASALLGPVDTLLRFVIILPPDSPYSLPLATSLLICTLQIYRALAAYGLYSHIATTAAEHLVRLGSYVLSERCQSDTLKVAWLELLEAWIVCATDPHRTTPDHDILWSQVTGWSWGECVLDFAKTLHTQDDGLWTAIWNVLAAWLEGAKINSARNGEAERSSVLGTVRTSFEDGSQRNVLSRSGQTLDEIIDELERKDDQSYVDALRSAVSGAKTLAAAIRLWLASLPPPLQEAPEAPPFLLPFAQISALCRKITSHDLWQRVYTEMVPPYAYVFCRPLSLLLSQFLQLSRRLPEVSEGLWIAQAFAVLRKMLPGDELFRQSTLHEIINTITPSFFESDGIQWHSPLSILEKAGLNTIKPFLINRVLSNGEVHISPLCISPQSIAFSTTQRLSSASPVKLRARRDTPLPLAGDWFFAPLDHLLRSGQSEVFKSLPASWDGSETEVARATLVFARVSQDALSAHGLARFCLTREEVLFNCMKVFMLEHGQLNDDSQKEVFRDSIVGQLMEDLVSPYEAQSSPSSLILPYRSTSSNNETLDEVAARFLGPSVPFYQWYTDFVALYDAISFSHPLFSRLLLPPTSMRYPLDCRKFLWADYGHIIRTIRTAISSAITGNIGEFLFPVEVDAHVNSAYLRALVRGTVEGFVRFVAVHHVASNIWPDFQESHVDKEQAEKLLRAVVDQGPFDTVREVVCYRQVRKGKILIPPECFEQDGVRKASRLEFLAQCGEDLKERLKNLLE